MVYLNGAEIWRDTKIMAGPLTCTTPVLLALGGADETNWLALNLPPSILNLLQPGWNTIAAEVHNQSLSGSDLGFNFEWTGAAMIAARRQDFIAGSGGSLSPSWPSGAISFNFWFATNPTRPVAWARLTNGPSVPFSGGRVPGLSKYRA